MTLAETYGFAPEELAQAWAALSPEERVEGFRLLSRADADDFFLQLPTREQAELIKTLPAGERRSWVRLLPPDDVADLIQESDDEVRDIFLHLLDDATRKEVAVLLAYAEDDAGGLMNPRFARLRPDMTADEAISYLRRQTREHIETIYYAYVLDSQQKLLGVASFRQLMTAPGSARIRDIMRTEPITVHEEMDQEAVSHVLAQHDLLAIPVVDAEGRMKGIVTADDIVDVVKEEATEDMQKIGGTEALDKPYLEVSIRDMIRKRGVWLIVLFLGQTLTANVMEFFEGRLGGPRSASVATAVLMIFIPLIVSSGGNSGSQAATLIVRALALGEVQLRFWWAVALREVTVGVVLGLILALLGLARILLWQIIGLGHYSDYYALVALAVAGSLVAVVTWGTLAGSMLPLLLRRLGFDPASASTPFVATLCDVTGLIIYFSIATVVLRGTLL